MEKEIIKEIMSKCNIIEKIKIKLLEKTFIKVYHIIRIKIINDILKNKKS